ncbi:MAG: LOG family protein [Chloroflexota bacterium]
MKNDSELIITVFGSSRSVEDDADYAEAMEVGRQLAAAGFTVCNGGYAGSMEAVSRGARDAGGRVVGITVDTIARTGNAWLDEEIRTSDIFRRIEEMVTFADGFVALRGGAGTLAEVALTMNLLYLGALQPRPLVLLGDDWRTVMGTVFDRLYSNDRERALLGFAATPLEVVRQLRQSVAKAGEPTDSAGGVQLPA